MEVAAVVDTREAAPAPWAAECERRGIRVRTGSAVVGTRGTERVSAALVGPFDRAGLAAGARSSTGREPEEVACDLLLVSGGWNPAVHLHSQARGRLAFDAGLGAFLPAERLEDLKG